MTSWETRVLRNSSEPVLADARSKKYSVPERRHRLPAWASASMLALLVSAIALLPAFSAHAQQESSGNSPSSITLSGSVVYSDQSSTTCDQAHPVTPGPFAGMNPLTCHAQTALADTHGQCSLKGMVLLQQQGTTCYYCSPINPPIVGIIIPFDDGPAANLQGYLCGGDEADPDCKLVCTRQTGSGPYIPPAGTVSGSTPVPQPIPAGISTPGGPGPTIEGVPRPGPPPVAGAANPCLPFGPGGYDYCANPTQPAGCVCTKPAIASKIPPPAPLQGGVKQPSNPIADTGQYLQGMIAGLGGCVQGFGSLIAGAGYFLQGDFVNAAKAWGVTPGESMTLKTIYAEMTAPVIGSASNPYTSGVTAGRRLCTYALVPGVTKAVGTALKAGLTKGGPQAPPPTKGIPPAGGSGGGGPPSAPPGEIPPVGGPEGNPPAGTAGGGTPPGTEPNLPPSTPEASPTTAGASSATPIQGEALQNALNQTPKNLPNTWVELTNGPAKLGDFVADGSFADVYKYGPGEVIKLSKNGPATLGYGPDSILGQKNGAAILQGIAGVETPQVTGYQPPGPNTPASLIAEDVSTKYPGSFTLSSAGYQKLAPALQGQAVAAVTEASNAIGNAGYVMFDPNPSNFSLLAEGNAYKPIIHDADMIMTPTQIKALPPGSPQLEVLDAALELGGEPDLLSQGFTAESMMQVINTARIKLLTGITNVPSDTLPPAAP